MLLSYPLLLTGARRPIVSFAVERGATWRIAHAIGGCLGVSGLLIATASLCILGTAPERAARNRVGDPGVSVSPSNAFYPALRSRVQRTGSLGGQRAGSSQAMEQGRTSSRRDGAGRGWRGPWPRRSYGGAEVIKLVCTRTPQLQKAQKCLIEAHQSWWPRRVLLRSMACGYYTW